MSRMIGDQGTFRAIRVICGESGSEDWPQRGAEVTKRRRHFEPLICANRRSFRTADCPRKPRRAESEFLTTDITGITDVWSRPMGSAPNLGGALISVLPNW